MQNCYCYQRLTNTNEDNYCIPGYYYGSKLYPKITNRKNVIITAETTLDCFVTYCSNKKIDAFDSWSIDAVVAVAMAAKIGNITLLEALVKTIGIEILNRHDQNYFTPLHIVCHETRVEKSVYTIEQLCIGAKKLIELGANPNIPSCEGFTALSTSAVKAENGPLTDVLIQNGAKLTLCVHHLTELITKIRENITEAQKPKFMIIAKLLYIAQKDAGSELSIFSEDLIKVIALVFWRTRYNIAHLI